MTKLVMLVAMFFMSFPVSTPTLDSPLPEPFEPFAEYTVTNDCDGWGVTNYKVYEHPSGSGNFYQGIDVLSENMHGHWGAGVSSIEWRNKVRWFYDGSYYFFEKSGVLSNPCAAFLPIVF